MNGVFGFPTLTVEAGGSPLSAEDTFALAEVRVQQRLSLPTMCELVFYDAPDSLRVTTMLDLGTPFRVLVSGHPTPLFVGEVTAIEYGYGAANGQEIRVRGYDLLHRLRKRQTVRAHVQITPADLARELVADLGLNVAATDTGPVWQRVIQHRQSDLELLVNLAERCGLYLTVWENTLNLVTLEGTGDAVSLELGDSLFEARVEVNADPAVRSVAAAGWNPLRVETHNGQASSARVGRSVSAEAPPERVGVNGTRDLVNEVAQDDSHAEAFAQAELDVRVAREVVLSGTAEGNPLIRAGGQVYVSGIAAEVAGFYVVTSVNHQINKRAGFVSEFSTAPPSPLKPARTPIAALGVVTQIDDPENVGRVRVSLPTYGGVETGWMSTVSVGAGAGKGLMAQPDVDDLVLVLFADDDPGQGVIIGSLYGVNGPPDVGIEGGIVRRYTLLTPGGQRIRLDDTHNIIRVENKDGSYVELAPQKVRVHAATDLDIEAPGKTVTVRAQAINFERG
ncbi:MAG: type IV secretion protein Rhs [Chloroflexi bacterium]|nr:type IV secretion protein Rhs [Chloroflexota bacterium]